PGFRPREGLAGRVHRMAAPGTGMVRHEPGDPSGVGRGGGHGTGLQTRGTARDRRTPRGHAPVSGTLGCATAGRGTVAGRTTGEPIGAVLRTVGRTGRRRFLGGPLRRDPRRHLVARPATVGQVTPERCRRTWSVCFPSRPVCSPATDGDHR